MTNDRDEFAAGAAAMKAQVLEALAAAHARDTAGDICSREDPCSQCTTWYRAIDAVQALEP